jgi:hypothetical protein
VNSPGEQRAGIRGVRRASYALTASTAKQNSHTPLPAAHVRAAADDFLNFLSLLNLQLHARGMGRLETTLTQAGFGGPKLEYANV